MKLTLVRHGETQWNREKKIQGITDMGLTETGLEQANKLSIALQREDFDSIVTSPLKRAYDTAMTIARFHAVPVRVEKALQELNAGEFEGLSYQDLLIHYPAFLGQWRQDHGSVVMPNGESLQEVQQRAWPVIQNILANSRHALVVSHSFVIITILCKIQKLDLSQSSQIRIGVASRTCIEIANGSACITTFNDTSHLQEA